LKKIILILIFGFISPLICRSSSYPFISGDTFRAFCDHVFDETTFNFNKKINDGDTIFVQTGMLDAFFGYIHPHIQNKYILVTHNNDVGAPGNYRGYLEDPKIIVWFAENADINHKKLIPIPIGIANSQWPHGNVANFKAATKHINPWYKRKKDKLVYVNFRVETNRVIREPIWNFFAHQPFSYMAPIKDHREFLDELGSYVFAASPPGGGVDCHRAWEALLMGTIPLIKHSTIDPVFDDLPVILVHNWHEITED